MKNWSEVQIGDWWIGKEKYGCQDSIGSVLRLANADFFDDKWLMIDAKTTSTYCDKTEKMKKMVANCQDSIGSTLCTPNVKKIMTST